MTEKAREGSAFPEFVSRRDYESGSWDVKPGYPNTDIANKRMSVPTGKDKHSAAIRAREVMRAKVSPASVTAIDASCYSEHVTQRILESCESLRINALNKCVGNEVDGLHTGIESRTVAGLVAARDVEGLISLITSTYGTKSGNSVTRAIKKVANESGLKSLPAFASYVRRTIRREASWWFNSGSRTQLSSTRPYSVGGGKTTIPSGFRHSIELASQLGYLFNSTDGTSMDPFDNDETGVVEIDSGKVPEAGSVPSDFAKLSIQKLPLTERVAGRMGRRRSATNIGVNPRRMHRYLVDPEKRIFDRRIKGIGGVVLIDQSGSMSLSTEEIWDIIKASPGCTIIGYSNGRASRHNCWVLAENGKVVSEVRPGNGGNGVDGPALLFALSKRKKGDPVIWVCDGYVTGNDDSHSPALSRWCANVVAKHGVHMTPNVPEAIEALKQVRDGRKLPTRATGPVLEQMLALY